MMKKIYTTLIVLVATLTASAQGWYKLWRRDAARLLMGLVCRHPMDKS